MRKKLTMLTAAVLAFAMVAGTGASAFEDVPQGVESDKIMALKERGIISGYGAGEAFMGQKKITNAEAVHILVKGLDLSLAAFLFIKAPETSDSFDAVPNDQWYSESFIIAAVNGLDLPRDIDPQGEMTREQFAHYLFTAMMLKGNYPFTKMLYAIADDADLNPDYRNSVQLLLNAKIAVLDDAGKFAPKQPITRQEAAVMLYQAMEFVKAHQPQAPDDGAQAEEQVTLAETKVNEDVNQWTLSWGEKPNPGYQLNITSIQFRDDQTAEIHYKLSYPEKDKSYAQVITTPQAATYLAAGWKAVPVQDQ